MADRNACILAVAGKGGVGKTSVAACMVRLLSHTYPDKKILAIDADPAVGLSTALGIEPALTVDDIRESVVDHVEKGETKAALEILSDARCGIFDALVEREGFSFLAVGRPESAGCYCKVNAYLKEVISHLSQAFDYVVIDGEAGIEQINRRVMEKVTHLFLITDASKKGTQVIQTIDRVSKRLDMADAAYAIANRLPLENGRIPDFIRENMDTGEIPVLTYIPADPALSRFDILGEDVTTLPEEAPIVCGVRQALEKSGIL